MVFNTTHRLSGVATRFGPETQEGLSVNKLITIYEVQCGVANRNLHCTLPLLQELSLKLLHIYRTRTDADLVSLV